MAAVLGAQAWLSALRAPTLSTYSGGAAAAALAAVYCRASGEASQPVPGPGCDYRDRLRELSDRLANFPPLSLGPTALASLSAAADWALEHGFGAPELVAPAEDLAAGWELPQLAAASDALHCLAAALL